MSPVLSFYRILITLLAPFALAVAYVIMRKKKDTAHFAERFGLVKLKSAPRQKSVWFHAASVGEVKSIKNLTDAIRAKYPDCAIIVSTFTTTGRKEAETFIKADEFFLLPLENSAALKHLIKLLGVKVFFIVDTEIWPNMIATASENTAAFMINARMTEKTCASYYKFRFFFRPLLKKFTAILAKSSEDAARFEKVTGSDKNIAVIGNIKFQSRKRIEDIEPIAELNGIKYLLAASTHDPEESIFIEAFKKCGNNFDKLIIAPRHPVRAKAIKEAHPEISLMSEDGFNNKIVIADAFGILEKLYIGADKIFIGGSIAKTGGHNIYEALQFGKPVATGANMQNFAEIHSAASKHNLTVTVNTADDISAWAALEDGKHDFSGFFSEIDDANNKTIETILELIEQYLANEETI